jgi:hypothetical protein
MTWLSLATRQSNVSRYYLTLKDSSAFTRPLNRNLLKVKFQILAFKFTRIPNSFEREFPNSLVFRSEIPNSLITNVSTQSTNAKWSHFYNQVELVTLQDWVGGDVCSSQ